MKKKYKALMLDLDGTTIPNHRDGLPSQKVIDAIAKAQKKLFVCIATGRPFLVAEPVLSQLHITDPVILLGGSQIMHGSSGEYIHEQPLHNEDVLRVLELLQPYHKKIFIDKRDESFVYIPGSQPENVSNVLVINLTQEKADEMIETLSGIKTVTAHKVVSWKKGEVVLNISHALANKQYAIYEVAKLLGIQTHEIIGVGDGYNDFPLLMACGLKIAMGNAVPELQAIADYIAPDVEDDGVADVIEKFIL